jgi:hypothetical protein
MKPRNIYRIVIGVLMIVNGIVSILFPPGDAIIGTFFLCAGSAFLATGIIRHRRDSEGPESDERSEKIGAYGLSWAWLTGLLFMFGLFWLDYLSILRLSSHNTLATSILVLTLSAVLYQTFLFRKGDVG